MTEEIHRDLGRHEAEILALQGDMVELKRDVKQILSTLSEAKGGWRTLMMVAGVAGAMGAVFAKIATFAWFVPK